MLHSQQPYKTTGFFLTFLGYFSLMFSVGLQPRLSTSLGVSIQDTHLAISILFMTFSISAISFTCLSDIFGAYKVLKYAQIISIIGLCVAYFTESKTVLYFAFFLIGIGTGCYPGVARSLITRHAKDHIDLKKTYAIVSALLVLAPTLGTLFGNAMAKFNSWQTSYLIVAVAEILLLVYSQKVLRQDAKFQTLINLSAIHHILLSHSKNRTFIISMLMLSLCYCAYIQVILVNLEPLLQYEIKTIHLSFYIIILLLAGTYVVSTVLVGKLSHILHKKRILIIMLTIISTGVLLFSSGIPALILIGIYIITFGVGFLGPMSTSLGMLTISTGYGIASAMITFTNSLTASLFTFIESKLALTSYSFMLAGFCAILFGLILLTFLKVYYTQK